MNKLRTQHQRHCLGITQFSLEFIWENFLDKLILRANFAEIMTLDNVLTIDNVEKRLSQFSSL